MDFPLWIIGLFLLPFTEKIMTINTRPEQYTKFHELENCRICPRNCGANRYSDKLGYCKSDAGFNIASVCNHRGEEPVISGQHGICNVFFSHCNLQCIYCQNHQISFNNIRSGLSWNPEKMIGTIVGFLETGCKSVGFVSPSHHIPQMTYIIRKLRSQGQNPIFVYNSNAYDKPESLAELEGMIDVYLPDFKYSDRELSRIFSDTADYPAVALKAIREMYRQKGSTLHIDDEGIATSGMIIRHLVLPGYVQDSIDVLRTIAEEISVNVHISLMSQYYPTRDVMHHKNFNRALNSDEYQNVVDEFHRLGFRKGWIQELTSADHYHPDFRNEHPFED